MARLSTKFKLRTHEHRERGVAFVEMDGQRLKDGSDHAESGLGEASGTHPHGRTGSVD